MKKNYFSLIYKIVRQIPKGKMATYGQVAKMVNEQLTVNNQQLTNISAKFVGWALHANKDKNTPCHRVVDRTGRLAPNFAFDGWREQKRRLEEEGVEFIDENHVDLGKCGWF